jgi:hypothetical protein
MPTRYGNAYVYERHDMRWRIEQRERRPKENQEETGSLPGSVQLKFVSSI